MPIGETTVKPKTTRQTLQEITFHLSIWPSDSLVPKCLQPHFEKHKKSANPLAVRVVPAGQDVFLKGRLHEACVLSDDSFYITTTWEGATNKSQSLNFLPRNTPKFQDIADMFHISLDGLVSLPKTKNKKKQIQQKKGGKRWLAIFPNTRLICLMSGQYQSFGQGHVLRCPVGCDVRGGRHHQCPRRSSCDIAEASSTKSTEQIEITRIQWRCPMIQWKKSEIYTPWN